MMVSLSSFLFFFVFFHSNLSFLFIGPYNNIKSWNYTALITAFDAKAYTYKVTTEAEAEEALQKVMLFLSFFSFFFVFFPSNLLHQALERKDALNFIECILDRDDCSKELLEWGSRVASANSRPPNPR